MLVTTTPEKDPKLKLADVEIAGPYSLISLRVPHPVAPELNRLFFSHRLF